MVSSYMLLQFFIVLCHRFILFLQQLNFLVGLPQLKVLASALYQCFYEVEIILQDFKKYLRL